MEKKKPQSTRRLRKEPKENKLDLCGLREKPLCSSWSTGKNQIRKTQILGRLTA